MANIALLNRCNLRCPYCFADSYMADESTDIDESTFSSLLDFAAPDGELGIIGGEPLLHKSFEKLLLISLRDMRLQRITVFTNGIFIDKHIDVLCHPRVQLLINVNSRRDIGKQSFERLDNNIGELLRQKPHGISLGINVYEKGQDFSDLLYLLKKYSFQRVRVSVVIPHDKQEGGIKYFLEMKPTLLKLYKALAELGVCPCYDCNAIPECVYTEEERALLERLPFANSFERDIFLGKRSVCSPVIDLYPDGSATRCFGCYDMARVKVADFESIGDLRNYFFKEIDARLVQKYPYEKCKTCYKNKVFGCFGGCLCYLGD